MKPIEFWARFATIVAVLSVWTVGESAAAAQQSNPAGASNELTVGGWTFMILSLVFVTGLTLWCFKRVLTTPGEPTDPGPASKP